MVEKECCLSNLCKNIFNQLGHWISIESKVNQGTTVCLDFSKKEIFIE